MHGIVLHIILWQSGRSGVIESTATPHGDIGTSRYRYQSSHKEQSSQRVSQGPNALNKSMQGLWQKRKVNLNSTTQTIPSTSTPTPPPPPPSTSTPSDEPPRPEPAPSPASGAVEGTPPVPVPSTSSQIKRKLRSTRGDEGNKRSRTGTGNNTSKEYAPPTVRLSDLGGVDPCVEKMLELVAMPLTHPEVYLHTGVQPPRGVLLYGPPGCGKTMLANAIGGVRALRTSA